MGMYDTVRCHSPLMPAEHRDRVWQTKGLEKALQHYHISRAGLLWREEAHYDKVPPEERPYWGTPAWHTDIGPQAGSYRRMVDCCREVTPPYQGWLSLADDDGEGLRYLAHFEDGHLTALTPTTLLRALLDR